jgi:hypothetical protein
VTGQSPPTPSPKALTTRIRSPKTGSNSFLTGRSVRRVRLAGRRFETVPRVKPRPWPVRSRLQRPASGSRGRIETDFLVEDRRTLRDACLADAESVGVRNHSHLAVVSTAEGAHDVAEVGSVLQRPR